MLNVNDNVWYTGVHFKSALHCNSKNKLFRHILEIGII